MKKKQVFTLVLSALCVLFLTTAAPAQGVVPDVNLAAAVREALDLPPGSTITLGNLRSLTVLSAPERQITDLTGLEHATQLETLILWGNRIYDIWPLDRLTQLKVLSLSQNEIRYIRAVSDLTELEELYLSNNEIWNISAVANLTKLETLGLWGNQITDIRPLARLTQLKVLYLSRNEIRDISAVANLTKLETLDLGINEIDDINAVSNLTKLETLYLDENEIWNISAVANLTKLETLYLSDNWISDIRPLRRLTQLKVLTAGHNEISDISAVSALRELEELYLNSNEISDIRPLRRLTQLKVLALPRNEIRDISAVANLTKLEELYLNYNEIRDISAVANLTKLETLNLHTNEIRDISAVSNLTKLETLSIRDNEIRNIQPIAGLTQLKVLYFRNNPIQDLRPLRRLLNQHPELSVDIVLIGASQAPAMCWIDTQDATLQRLTGSTTVGNPIPSVQNATALALDGQGRLYWSTQINRSNRGTLNRATLHGTNVRKLRDVHGVPVSLAVDAVGERLYWADALGKIQRSNLEGRSVRNLVTVQEDVVLTGIALDIAGEHLYWAEKTGVTTGNIRRAHLDGSNVELIRSIRGVPQSIAVDSMGGKLYLTNGLGKIQRMNLDGSNFRSNFITDLNAPLGLAVDVANGKLYWTDTDELWRANLNGSRKESIVTGIGRAVSLALNVLPGSVAGAPANAFLETMVPDEMRLLANYPNPFNPETWIPYQLAEPADVTLTIYAVDGKVVRRLDLGHQAAGFYQSKSRAAYWDGRNNVGERVASGLYFYTLKAGDFAATGKMLIRK